MPASASSTTRSGELMSFFMANPRYDAAPRPCRSAGAKLVRAGGPTETGRLDRDLEDDEVREGRVVDDRRKSSADERADDRHPRVAPIGLTLAGDRQDRMDDARAEVAGGIDRVSGGAAERKPDDHDEQRYGERTQRRRGQAMGLAEREDHEHEHEGADDLRDHVEGVVADCRAGAEDG